MEERLNRAMWDGRRKRGQRGFTLIELLVVIAVLGVLAAIVIFNVTGVKNKGSNAACATDTASMQTAVDASLNNTPPGVFAAGAITATTNGGPSIVPQFMHTFPTSCSGGFTLVALTGGGFNVVGTGTGTTFTG